MQKVCGIKCALAYAEAHRTAAAKRERAVERKEIRDAKQKAKTRGQWMKEAQAAVNQYVRTRDAAAGLPCISCGRFHQGQNHAGHYRSVGSAPHLRFDADRNIALQCQPCNVHLHGNLVLFRKNLIDRIGLEAVEDLESDQEPRHYSIDDLKKIIKEFKDKTKEILRCTV